MVLDAEATTCGGGFADNKNDLCTDNAWAAGDLYGVPGVGAPTGPERDPFLTLFSDR